MDNYFNYFTEIERYYQSKRESFTLLSTLDWVLIETWKDQGIPLDAVLKGMDRAFSRAKRKISSLAYCAKDVAEVVKEQKDMRIGTPDLPEFSADEVTAYLENLADQVRRLREKFPEFEARFDRIAKSIREQGDSDLQTGEQALGALEEKLISIIKIAADEDSLIEVAREVERNLTPFRKTMTVEQIAMLDQQLWKRKLMERYSVPRLSLFYLI